MDGQHVKIVKDIRVLMAYHHALGIEAYPLGAAIFQLLDRKVETAARVKTLPHQRKMTPVVSETLQNIAAEVTECHNCDLHAGRVVSVPGRGRTQARLLIVGGWLTAPGQAVLSPEMIFGQEEDRMLSRMLEAIHLVSDDVFVTNILKCGLPESSQPVAANIQCCLAYLRRQIAVISPELICSMGIIATRALLDLPQSLSQLRGRFHSYTAFDGRQIPLMPTYHPSYLLQATEMKSETWKDLQLIEKKLAGEPIPTK
ncbi:MAG: uracil-DNA glycosylase [Proteobacteria bacterium]|nr:uracil-DNA glycosylase [Pseudomonadota bacterium]MBU1647854.1 uracil-DNA glycosylase [Pseudomonadota bacterium]MBU1986252.1 uracil-DNA glycosylase [Pseudomonadota bacterium]